MVFILWENIESLYAFNSENNKLYLLNHMMNMRYKESSSILIVENVYQLWWWNFGTMDDKYSSSVLWDILGFNYKLIS